MHLAYRLRELGIQDDNAALLSSTMEVSALNAEVAAIYDTIYNIHEEVKFNEKALNERQQKLSQLVRLLMVQITILFRLTMQ